MQEQQTASSLGHLPTGQRWEFDESVTDVFDDMLERSIPQYAVMRDAVHDAARRHVVPGASIVDLGCSRGGALARFVEELGAANRYFGVDVSEPMLEAARERFRGHAGIVHVDRLDLRESYPDVGGACVTMAVLTLQFVPINYRQKIVQTVYEQTRPGGAFVVVEKVLGSGSRVDDLMVDAYHALKARNGYTREEIDRKRLALEGVLVPVTARWNEELLRSAGFREVDCIWRWFNFAAWVAVK
jgi:tRNA (cmo5U34)-methyltransferase